MNSKELLDDNESEQELDDVCFEDTDDKTEM